MLDFLKGINTNIKWQYTILGDGTDFMQGQGKKKRFYIKHGPNRDWETEALNPMTGAREYGYCDSKELAIAWCNERNQ